MPRGCLKSLVCTHLNGAESAEQTFEIKRRLVAVGAPARCEYSEWRGIRARQSRVTLAWRHFLCTEHTHALTFTENLQASKCRRLAANEGRGRWYANESFINCLRNKNCVRKRKDSILLHFSPFYTLYMLNCSGRNSNRPFMVQKVKVVLGRKQLRVCDRPHTQTTMSAELVKKKQKTKQWSQEGWAGWGWRVQNRTFRSLRKSQTCLFS